MQAEGHRRGIVVSGRAAKKIRFTNKLNQIGARCRAKRLVDAKGVNSFLPPPGCWGKSAENYQEILENQQQELARLRRRYRVIEISCNPTGVLIQ